MWQTLGSCSHTTPPLGGDQKVGGRDGKSKIKIKTVRTPLPPCFPEPGQSKIHKIGTNILIAFVFGLSGGIGQGKRNEKKGCGNGSGIRNCTVVLCALREDSWRQSRMVPRNVPGTP
ncbi:hypothetical protein TcCL_NonESM11860 [Trypanosoma cruzi]|nr:hypothetical protein TcCL_NonESM11860 [Trypanosoma cruzi]